MIEFKSVFIYPAEMVTTDPDDWCNKIMIGLDYKEVERVADKYKLIKKDQKWMFIGNNWIFSKFSLNRVKWAFRKEGHVLIISEVFPCPFLLKQGVGDGNGQGRDFVVGCGDGLLGGIDCGLNTSYPILNVGWDHKCF
jgi:hypothetical protein